jgi:predicted RND superfamily exporter protein
MLVLFINKINYWKVFLIIVVLCCLSLLLVTIKPTVYDLDEPRAVAERDLQILDNDQQNQDEIDARQNRVLNLLDDDDVDPDVIRPEIIRTDFE